MANLIFNAVNFDDPKNSLANQSKRVLERLRCEVARGLAWWSQARSDARMMRVAQTDPRIARELQVAWDRQQWTE